MTDKAETDAIAALASMWKAPPRRSGQFEFYSSPDAIKSAFAWPAPAPVPSQMRVNWCFAVSGRKSPVRIRCKEAAYGLSTPGTTTITFRHGDKPHVVVVDDHKSSNTPTHATIICGQEQFSAITACKKQARRVPVNIGEAPRMRRILEYIVESTDNTPSFVIQIRPHEPAVWYQHFSG